MQDLVIILPTHKRQNYLDSKIKYYADCGYEVHICDSTPDEFYYGKPLPSNISYHWMPTSGFYDKVLTMLEQTESKLVILTPDDDFLDLNTLNECKIKMLSEENNSLSVGLQVFYNEPYDGEWYVLKASNRLQGKNLMQDKITNAGIFGGNYQNVLWSLFRRDVIFEAFSKLKRNNPQNANFIELTLAWEASVRGWVYISQNCLNYREILIQQSHWGAEVTEISAVNLMKNHSLQMEMDILINQYDNQDKKIVKAWCDSYLNTPKIAFTKRAINKILRIVHLNNGGKVLINPNPLIDRLLKGKE